MNSEYLGRSVLPCVAVVDQDGVICSVNDGWKIFARQNGYTGDRFGVGERYFSHCRTAETKDLHKVFHDIMMGRRERFQLEYPCHSPTEERWYLMEIMSLPMPHGTYGLISHANITLAKKLHDDLVERNDRLKKFAAIAAHDLRSPLRKARQLFEIARYDLQSDSDAAEVIDRGLENISQMQTLLDSYISHFLTSSMELKKQKFNLRNFCKEMRVSNALLEHGMVQCEFPNVDVETDRMRLEIVLRNLVSNAFKYNRSSEPKVIVSAEIVPKGMHISVSDNGIGISENIRSHIFDMAFSTDTNEDKPASGLGLSVVKEIIDALGGKITVYSEVGKGSRFQIFWPL